MVLLLAAVLALGGVYAWKETPVDAIPDLSDVQVIIKTPFPGQAPGVVEDQVTYPLSDGHAVGTRSPRRCAAIPFSVLSYRLCDLCGRHGPVLGPQSRVLEYLNVVADRACRTGVTPRPWGRTPPGVGWVYAVRSGGYRSGRLRPLAQLRSVQDWFPALRTDQLLPGVSRGGQRSAASSSSTRWWSSPNRRGVPSKSPCTRVKSPRMQRSNRDVGGSAVGNRRKPSSWCGGWATCSKMADLEAICARYQLGTGAGGDAGAGR